MNKRKRDRMEKRLSASHARVIEGIDRRTVDDLGAWKRLDWPASLDCVAAIEWRGC
jgi:hypothetical protein